MGDRAVPDSTGIPVASTTTDPPEVTDTGELMLRLEQHRVELTGYCYRMLGSVFEADDAVQETFVRAWRGIDRFEGRASLRSWLYRIATNVCLTALEGRRRRARPMEMAPASTPVSPLGPPLPETAWVEPAPSGEVFSADGDPAEQAALRDTVRLAFIAALQHLAPRQRAVLILRDVLAFHASEVANLLGTTVASVNSALQRARARIAASKVTETDSAPPMDEAQRALLDRYVDAFERYDFNSLTSLLHEEATLSMPPYRLWLRGPEAICEWMLGAGHGCRGSRLVPVRANDSLAFGQYRRAPGGGHEPWALQVIEVSDGLITGLNAFLDTERLFPRFGLPPRLDPRAGSLERPAAGVSAAPLPSEEGQE